MQSAHFPKKMSTTERPGEKEKKICQQILILVFRGELIIAIYLNLF